MVVTVILVAVTYVPITFEQYAVCRGVRVVGIEVANELLFDAACRRTEAYLPLDSFEWPALRPVDLRTAAHDC